MPKRNDLKSICIIGAGPIVIGQACEFDYSGAQACKALREEGYRVVLINSNPATIMTDPDMADATYIEPITPEIVTKILEKEKPEAVLPTMGGQTALNTALALDADGTLERLGIELIGAKADVIDRAEDRQKFRDCMDELGLESPRSVAVHSIDEAFKALDHVKLPAIMRPSFTMGGTGGGVAYNRQEFENIVREGLDASPVNEVLVEESVLGWKEYEMEVVRDKADNCIIICSIENIDPMGIHTGDSITVAPAMTLTDKEYQIMRNASIAVLRKIGVETGGSNVQFAVNPADGRMVVIEMNPRVSRSSALASKATGFPIAKVAAKLAVGCTLDELGNDITGGKTPASFEPTIDYVVTKIPRFAFDKFKGTTNHLTTAMKSVGEAMAFGRNIEESMQKALRSLETGLTGFDEIQIGVNKVPTDGEIRAALSKPTPDRLLVAAQAMREGMDLKTIHSITFFDPWFLERIKNIVDTENKIRKNGLPTSKIEWIQLKQMGFADIRLSTLTGQSESDIRANRLSHDCRPVYKRVDSCAAEIPSETPYMYGTYEMPFDETSNEITPTTREKIVILGGGPNRIGQGIEFDYCCVHACSALKESGYETIMINCNPETVSTDYDTANRLYFEPLTGEDVMNIIEAENKEGAKIKGVIVQLGGQTPLKLAQFLKSQGIEILGTDPDMIDLAEDREQFKALLQKLELRQPFNDIGYTRDELIQKGEAIGYPLVIRPSFVLGGAGMEIVHSTDELENYIDRAIDESGENPVLLDRYLNQAIEVDVDVLSDGKEAFITGIMEHIEEAGIHSGDSSCVLPPHSLPYKVVRDIERQSQKLAMALNVRGLMNVQFAVKTNRDTGEHDIYILEVNPRASRTVPFVAKATGVPIAKLAANIMAGDALAPYRRSGALDSALSVNHSAVKAPVFPFNRFAGVDSLLGPEMRSTGEVMGIDKDLAQAYAKAQLGASIALPTKGTVFLSVRDKEKDAILSIANDLIDLGFTLVATRGTYEFLSSANIAINRVNKVSEGQPHIVDGLINGEIDLMINITKGRQAMSDGMQIRRTALMHKVPYYTNLAAATAAIGAIRSMVAKDFDVKPLQSYFNQERNSQAA
jgi:carbamoyl-phosphate synthase large subunit